jgi:hypothetical protein
MVSSQLFQHIVRADALVVGMAAFHFRLFEKSCKDLEVAMDRIKVVLLALKRLPLLLNDFF